MSKEDDKVLLPGKIYDIVRQHEDVKFDRAKYLIQRSKLKVIESSANVFRQCLQALPNTEAHNILQQTYNKTKKETLKLTYLSKINNDGLYTSSSQRFYGSTSSRLNEANDIIPDTLVELECFYESILRGLADGQTALQGFNLSNPASVLKTMPYHTNPKLNPRLEGKHGINIPIFRLGTRHSFEEMHKTLGLLDRADILHWGACRLWLIVQLNFQRPLELRLANQLTRRGGYPPWCPMPTYHNEFMIVPSLLRKWAIPFEIIIQRPGDMVHLRDWVPHQVVDLGTNISETVSIGSAEWNMSADSSAFLNCPCGTKSNVGDNNFGGNTLINSRVELMVPRSKIMSCTHVIRAIEIAKREYNDTIYNPPPSYNRLMQCNFTTVPVIKEYKESSADLLRLNDKCYGCGKRTDDLQSHLNRHILCNAKLNLDDSEEPVTDESDEELLNDENARDHDNDARFRCSHCIKPFEHRIQLIKHVIALHKKDNLKRKADEMIVKKRMRFADDNL